MDFSELLPFAQISKLLDLKGTINSLSKASSIVSQSQTLRSALSSSSALKLALPACGIISNSALRAANLMTQLDSAAAAVQVRGF